MAKGDDGCLKGILIGCGGLLVLGLALGVFGYIQVVRPMGERVARLTELGEESERLHGRLEELDGAHPWDSPGDASRIVLDGEDVERWIRVRSALADEVAAVLESGRDVGPAADTGSVGLSDIREMFSTTFGSFEATARARVGLQRAAVDVLEAERMGPRELRDLLGLVEWRFLGREEAAFAGLPPGERDLFLELVAERREARRTLRFAERFGAEIDGRSAEELRRQIERAGTQISLLRDRAERGDIDPRAREALEGRRERLEALPAEGLDLLATLTEQEVETDPAKVDAGG